jgi:hypothetical protein
MQTGKAVTGFSLLRCPELWVRDWPDPEPGAVTGDWRSQGRWTKNLLMEE